MSGCVCVWVVCVGVVCVVCVVGGRGVGGRASGLGPTPRRANKRPYAHLYTRAPLPQHTHHTTPPHAPNSYYNAPDTVYYRAAKQLEAHLEGWLAAHVVAVDD